MQMAFPRVGERKGDILYNHYATGGPKVVPCKWGALFPLSVRQVITSHGSGLIQAPTTQRAILIGLNGPVNEPA